MNAQFAYITQPAFNCSIAHGPGSETSIHSPGAKTEMMVNQDLIVDEIGLITPVNLLL